VVVHGEVAGLGIKASMSVDRTDARGLIWLWTSS